MRGFYAGSFDPFTNGHLAIVKKASQCFEKVIVGIGVNTDKKRRIDSTEMKKAIEESIKQNEINNVDVVIYNGLTTEEAQKYNCTYLIRGLRNGTDYQYEENIATINEEHSSLDTCYFRAGKLGYLSSSMVMELYKFGKTVEKYVPKPVLKILEEKRKE